MTIISNGSIVTENGVVDGDVRIEDGQIAEIGPNLSGEALLDATDCWVLPGAIDGHVHISLEGHSTLEPVLDDLVGATASGLRGGVTTVGAYVQRTPNRDIVGSMRALIDYGNDSAQSDFSINALVLPGDDIEATVREGAELGITTYKTMVAYNRRGLMLDDEQIMQLMAAVAGIGGVTLVHAENGGAIDYLDRRERERGVDNGSYLRSQPAVLEAEGMYRTATFAELTGTRLLFVHLTSKEGADMLRLLKARDYGDRIFCETQPHYLALTNNEVLERGPLGKVGPPLKEADDVAAVWEAVTSGLVNNISSDHSPKSKAVKLATDNILDATFGGIGGVEAMLPLIFELGFRAGRISIVDVARLTSTDAARVYGLYPQKGTIQVGSDADLVLIPKDGEARQLVPANLHGPAEYSLYESLSSRGFPRDVVRRGVVTIRDNELTGDNPPGRYLARTGER